MQLIQAQVVKPVRQLTTRYGSRTAADIRLADGTEATLWRPANDPSLANLTMGQAVTVSKDHKGKVNLIDNAQPPALPQATATNAQGMTSEQKKMIAQYVTEQRDLLAFCLEQASTIPQAQTDDSVQKLGTALFIAAQRRFNLA